MQSISTIGLDIAKLVFQVHGVDAAGQVVLRRQLRRRHVLGFSFEPRHLRMRAFDRDLIRGGHYGQRSCVPR